MKLACTYYEPYNYYAIVECERLREGARAMLGQARGMKNENMSMSENFVGACTFPQCPVVLPPMYDVCSLSATLSNYASIYIHVHVAGVDYVMFSNSSHTLNHSLSMKWYVVLC